MATRVDRIVKAAYGMLAFIGHGITYKSQEVIMQLYMTLVRLCMQFLSFHCGKNRETKAGAEVVYQKDPWILGYYLQGGWTVLDYFLWNAGGCRNI